MARYVLQRKHDNSIVEGLSWNKKSHAESWIQEYIKIHNGLDWRCGGLFKCKNDIELEVVWSKSHKSVNWFCVETAPLSEYDPCLTISSGTGSQSALEATVLYDGCP